MSILKKNTTQYTWSDGKLIKGVKSITSLNFVLHYAAPSVWEGIRCYKTHNGYSEILSLRAHVDRLFDSAKIMGMIMPYDRNEVLEACKAVASQNGGGDLYLRPIAYSTNDAESVHQQNQSVSLDIYAFPMPHTFTKKGLRLGISSTPRGYPQYDMQAKATCNYKHLHLCEIEKKNRNVDDMLLLDNNGYVVEATVANIFVLKNGVLMTPPNDGSILPGITRQSIVTMFHNAALRSKGMKAIPKYPFAFAEKKLTKSDIYSADEVFLCGTYAEIVPVLEVENRVIGDGNIGKFTKYLMDEYEQIVRAKSKVNGIFMERIGK